MSKNYIAVIDESGGSRPSESNEEGFGIGAILFSSEKLVEIVSAGRTIGATVGKSDYKYKQVQESNEARKLFIDLLSSSDILCYGGYTFQSGVAEEIRRSREAVQYYGGVPPSMPELNTYHLLDKFLGYFLWPLIQHANDNNYTIELFWDRRSDMNALMELCKQHIDAYYSVPAFQDQEKVINLGGPASGTLNHVARLAGILAGDLRTYFKAYGDLIWNELDPNGLRGQSRALKRVASKRCSLADPNPFLASKDTVLLQGYYKAFLRNRENGFRIMTFCDGKGHYGVLQIEGDKLWHIYQLAD